MSQKHVVLAGVGAFVLGVVILACSDDPDRPRATSSGGTATGTSSGAPVVDGSTADGSSSSSGDGGGSSSGGSSGTSSGALIETGFRANVAGVATTYDVTPRAVRQSNGYVVELSGKDAPGNELKVTLTRTPGPAIAGIYNCSGAQGTEYAVITYTAAGGAETWTALANGSCTVSVQEIDNQSNGVIVGTFSGTMTKSGSPDKSLSGGQFRLTFD
jgi:hypothetical protein